MTICDLCMMKKGERRAATHSVSIEIDKDHHPEEYKNKDLDLCENCYAELCKLLGI